MSGRFQTLQEWLQWQETLHPIAIDPGLERVARVYSRMHGLKPAPVVVTVSGTNGKGSCVALLEQIALHAGYTTGTYTSPHLLSYNERVHINGKTLTDDAWMAAFAAVDAARGGESLTYFEFGTLAAFYLFMQHKPDFVVLEVGMGGRLDATNIINADAALISSIGLDHQQWLGSTRADIAREKAGILRPGCAAVCGDPQPPATLFEVADHLHSKLNCVNRDFSYTPTADSWDWRANDSEQRYLPLPRMQGPAQLRNAASVLMVLHLLAVQLPVKRAAIEQGLKSAMLPGRQQIIRQSPQVLIDVAHNAEAIEELTLLLRQDSAKRTLAVFAILQDKPVAEIVSRLAPYVDAWYLASARTERALPVAALARIVKTLSAAKPVYSCTSVAAAFAAARNAVQADERILVTGSFWTVAEVMASCGLEGL